MSLSSEKAFASPRPWIALAFLVATYFLAQPVERLIFDPIERAADLHMFVGGEMSLSAYGALMVVRLAWNLGLVIALWYILGEQRRRFPLQDAQFASKAMVGLAIGMVVMSAAILMIVACGDGQLGAHHQSVSAATYHGAGWLLFDGVGALGEELYGRAALLLVSERFVGRTGAVIVSALMFSIVHIHNPGASPIWLARLALQGGLLAYAVYKTGSLWWSVGYHTGWNWASAPLFGAAGSGYLDEGHLLDLSPSGPDIVTGGPVGPEGSILAFVAVAAALLLLRIAYRQRAAADHAAQ